MTKQEQYDLMLRFFHDCVRFWERALKTNSDIDKRPYINAIREIPHNNPYKPDGEPLDEDVRKQFYEDRMMDTYGTDWRNYA